MEAEIGKEGKKLLTKIPHEGNEITFEYKVYKGTYGEVAEAMGKVGLIMPSSSEIISLLYDASINLAGACESNILGVINENWLWESTGNDYLPKGKGDFQYGVLLQDNPSIVDRKLVMNKNDLIKKLNDAEEFRINGNPIFISKDRLARFVPFGFKIGYLTSQELAVHPYLVARYLGRKNNETEGADKLARIASMYKNNSVLYSFCSVNEEKIMASGIDSVFDHSRLYIGENTPNDEPSYGRCFGKLEDKSPV